MEITYDPAKDKSNRLKHGVSLSLAAEIDWSKVMAKVDTRQEYGEVREIRYAVVAGRLYCVVFTQRGDKMHVMMRSQGQLKRGTKLCRANAN